MNEIAPALSATGCRRQTHKTHEDTTLTQSVCLNPGSTCVVPMGGGASKPPSNVKLERVATKNDLSLSRRSSIKANLYVFSFNKNAPKALEQRKMKRPPLKKSDSAPNLLSSNTLFSPYVEVQVGKAGDSGARVQRNATKNMASKLGGGEPLDRLTDYYQFTPELPWLIKNAHFAEPTIKDFLVTRTIGKGKTGNVRIARTNNHKYMAIKTIAKDYIFSKQEERHIINEREIFYALNSPFCARLFAEFEDRENVYFAMEYVPGGELHRCLELQHALPVDTAKFYLTEIFAALEHVHAVGYVYRDLKPENVAIDEEGHVKLIDFGSAIRSDNNASGKLYTMCCSVPYMSPEQLNGKFTGGYTRIVDWWAYGILAYEILVGRTPFCAEKDTEYEVLLKILKNRITFPGGFEHRAKKFISDLLPSDPKARVCSARQIKGHDYYADIDHWEYVHDRQLNVPFVPEFSRDGDSHYFVLSNNETPANHWKSTNNMDTLVKLF